MRNKKRTDVPLPPSSIELKEAGFTFQERVGLRLLDIAGMCVQETAVHGGVWPSQLRLNERLGNLAATNSDECVPRQNFEDQQDVIHQPRQHTTTISDSIIPGL